LYILKGYTVQASPATWKAIQVVYPERGFTVKASPGTWKAIKVVYPERLCRPPLEPERLYKLYILKTYTGQPWNLEGYTGCIMYILKCYIQASPGTWKAIQAVYP
jgi:hypothetical protein